MFELQPRNIRRPVDVSSCEIPMTTGLKVTLSILIVIVGVIAMLGVVGVFFVRQIHVKETGTGDRKSMNFETPLGNMSLNARKDLDPSTIGIPIYPGATKSDDRGGAELQLDAGDFHKEFDAAGALFYTDDSVEKVREYYQEKFPDWKSQSDDKTGWHIETHDGQHIRSVSVKSSNGRTSITVASLGPPASN